MSRVVELEWLQLALFATPGLGYVVVLGLRYVTNVWFLRPLQQSVFHEELRKPREEPSKKVRMGHWRPLSKRDAYLASWLLGLC